MSEIARGPISMEGKARLAELDLDISCVGDFRQLLPSLISERAALLEAAP